MQNPAKPVASLIGVVILCLPIVPHLILAEMSHNQNSPAWVLDAIPGFTLLASLPIATIVAIVATIRRRAPAWSLIASWIVLLLSILAFYSIQAKNPFAG